MIRIVRKSNLSQQSAEKRRIAYSLAAGAAACTAAGTADQADAAISYSGLQNQAIAQFNSMQLDMDNYLGWDVRLKNYVFGGVNNYQGAIVRYYPGKLVLSNASFPYYVTALSPGELISSTTVGTSFYGSMALPSNPNAEFSNVTNAFFGLSFPAGAFGTLYGWVRVDVDNSAGTFLVKDWAYDDSGAGILAGDTGSGFVPEPGTLGMLAVGAAGLMGLRRRRQQAA